MLYPDLLYRGVCYIRTCYIEGQPVWQGVNIRQTCMMYPVVLLAVLWSLIMVLWAKVVPKYTTQMKKVSKFTQEIGTSLLSYYYVSQAMGLKSKPERILVHGVCQLSLPSEFQCCHWFSDSLGGYQCFSAMKCLARCSATYQLPGLHHPELVNPGHTKWTTIAVDGIIYHATCVLIL